MARRKIGFVCQSCGTQAPKWLGRCTDCGAWNSYIESEEQPREMDQRRFLPSDAAARPIPITEIAPDDGAHQPIGLSEVDRVLGGGLVPGSLILLGGDPGIGKSTLILQVLAKVVTSGARALYVTGEESAAQVRARATRLGADESQHLHVLTENALDAILRNIKALQPAMTVIDSIQTVYSPDLPAAPGTVGQLRDVATQLLYTTKGSRMATVLIGHVTKEGTLAGPRVLEHMVDTVLYFEGERGDQYRILRAVKNRFGSTNEIGVFEMSGTGLREVTNPSQIFLAERPINAAGSVVVVPLEGTRPLLVELQALVSHSGLANPRRTVIGVETSRVSLLAAVLDKVVGLQLADQDIFINAAGGIKIAEPASDLGIVAAMASSFRNIPINPATVLIGEVGLTGEVRAVAGMEFRLAEAAKLGFHRAIIAASQAHLTPPKGMECHGVRTLEMAFSAIGL
ncbi:MAG: DNA repair protein RadA [Deltaproteobacteria bacterium]|nr:DNA repair protein RadA [Deltaproteobacteria bacterium]